LITQAVLFDLDGTFADTAPDLHFALDQVLLSQGRQPLTYEQMRPTVSHGSNAMLRLAFGQDPESEEMRPIRQEFLNIYESNIARKTRLFAGMEGLIDTLDSRLIPWGIVTNKPSWLTDPLMAALGLRERAACIVSGDTTSHAKPHPEPILHACRTIGAEPIHSIYIGDAQRDIEAGRRAGTKTLIALFGYLSDEDNPEEWSADGEISHPLEILEWLE
jgi:phosphoglycolate phosphatase